MLRAAALRSMSRGLGTLPRDAPPSAAVDKIMRALTKTGQTLRVRALLVDMALFRRRAPATGASAVVAAPRDAATLKTKDMLVDEVRAELRDRGLDGIGKPQFLRTQLDKIRRDNDEADEVESLARALQIDAPVEPEPTAVEAAAVAEAAKAAALKHDFSDIRSKYALKLRARLGEGSVPTMAATKSSPGVGGASAKAESAFLASARAEAVKRDEQLADMRLVLGPPGLKSLLEFAAKRSMSVALVAGAESTERDCAQVLEQCGFEFDAVIDNSETAADYETECFRKACATLHVDASKVLALTDDANFADKARKEGLLSLIMVEENNNKPNMADYTVVNCVDIGTIINDLIGVSYRIPAPEY
ncbi:hypothetical protein M885DRAFT_610825 [Pelagophyceae sp. CCMP2097]|nr:hypothetical protein M885DRAFT_610825 [Pelagophyceae sp. CCMP2097]